MEQSTRELLEAIRSLDTLAERMRLTAAHEEEVLMLATLKQSYTDGGFDLWNQP